MDSVEQSSDARRMREMVEAVKLLIESRDFVRIAGYVTSTLPGRIDDFLHRFAFAEVAQGPDPEVAEQYDA